MGNDLLMARVELSPPLDGVVRFQLSWPVTSPTTSPFSMLPTNGIQLPPAQALSI